VQLVLLRSRSVGSYNKNSCCRARSLLCPPSCVLRVSCAQGFLCLPSQDTCGRSALSLFTTKWCPDLKQGLPTCRTLPRFKRYQEAVPIEKCVQISLICNENLASLPIPTIRPLASSASLGLEPGHMEEGDPCVRGGVGALPSEKDREKIQALSCRKA
jgi:hypothetical protein